MKIGIELGLPRNPEHFSILWTIKKHDLTVVLFYCSQPVHIHRITYQHLLTTASFPVNNCSTLLLITATTPLSRLRFYTYDTTFILACTTCQPLSDKVWQLYITQNQSYTIIQQLQTAYEIRTQLVSLPLNTTPQNTPKLINIWLHQELSTI